MFWKSLTQGLKLWAHPHVWLLVVIFLLLYLGYAWFVRRSTEMEATVEGAGPGCLVSVIGLLYQGLLMGAFLMLMLPTLLGPEAAISWSVVEPMGFIAVRAGLLGALAVTLLSFIPVAGRLLASSPGMEIFLMGAVTFRLLSPNYLTALLGEKYNVDILYPGIWENLAYLILGILATRLVLILNQRLMQLARRRLKRMESFIKVMVPSLDVLTGLSILLIYTQYVALRAQT